ncbi:MAG TPA: response regulator [Planctomycetaceae bacterium]|nr:response regulator [Planctomycetaceae bacterium]
MSSDMGFFSFFHTDYFPARWLFGPGWVEVSEPSWLSVILVTGIVSCLGVFLLARILPTALNLKSGREFQQILSECEQARESLEKERFLVQTLLQNLPEVIYFKDVQGRFTCVSQSLATSLGCKTTHEVVEKSDINFFPAPYAAAARADEEKVMKTGEPLVGKAEEVHWPGNRTAWVSTTKAPLRDKSGQIVGIFGISHDVTEIKVKEEALRVSEERYALAVQGSSSGIWDWDLTTGHVYYAARFRELIGFQEHEFPNRLESFRAQLHPDDVEPTFAAVDAHLKYKTPYDVEYRLRTKSDEYRWFHALGQALWDNSGRATRMAGSINDVTDRHRANERLRRVIAASPTALVMINKSRKLTLVNPQAAKLFGYTPNELLGREVEILIPERFRAEHPNYVRQFFGENESRQMGIDRDLRGLKKNGDEFPIEVSLSPLELDEGVFVLAGIVDVTESKRALEAVSLAREAAEASNRAKSEFLANMSHEIRTPMNAVIGITDLLLDTKLNDSQREYLSIVSQAGESLLTIINDILDFSKIEAGKIEMESIDFSLWDVVGDTLKSLALRAHSKKLELTYQIDNEVPEMLMGDPVRVRQVIVNLVGNAIKFTEAGEVLVDITCLSQNDTGVNLRFEFTDTGVGIAPEKQKLIFDAFTQSDSSTTRRFGGTGLGLAISSRLVSLMGGELTLHSGLGSGSVFSFSAWFPRSSSKASSGIHMQPELLKNLDVLIVDDNSTNRRILQEMVRSWHINPLLASSASEALQLLIERADAGSPVPLLITDIHMPNMDGFMLIEKLREHQAYGNLPIIVLSSGDRDTEAERSDRLNVAAYLTKPTKRSEMLTAIQNVLSADTTTSVDGVSVKSDDAGLYVAPLRILLAEDGAMNQKLAVALLSKWGHQVTVAEDGRQAVRAYETQPFDLVLMDVQMPEMDGFEATACIRALENKTDRHIPIVAMTARAMKGDRELCLESGMDGYIAKPIRQRELYQTIAAYFPATPAPATAAPAVDAPATEPLVVDWAAVLRRVEDDREVLRDVINCFLAEVPKLILELDQAARNDDAPVVCRAAHTLKSDLHFFGVEPLAELAKQIEDLGRSAKLQNIATLISDLKSQLKLLTHELEQYRESVGVSE